MRCATVNIHSVSEKSTNSGKIILMFRNQKVSQEYGIGIPRSESSSKDIPQKRAQIIICSFLLALIHMLQVKQSLNFFQFSRSFN